MHYVTKRVKNRTRLTAMLFAMLLLLTGCTAAPDNTKMTAQIVGGSETTGSASGEAANVMVQYLPKKVSNPDGLPVLKWLCLVDDATVRGAYETEWSEAVGKEVNRLLEEKDMPFRLQIVLMKGDGYFVDWSTTPEFQDALPDADLLYGFMYPEDLLAYLTPITEYITGDNPVLQNAIPDPVYQIPYTWKGEIYALAGEIMYPACDGWACDTELLEASGLSPEDLARDYWDMDAVFPALLEANRERTFLFIVEDGYTTNEHINWCIPSALNPTGAWVKRLPACYGIDYSEGSPTVVNILDTERIRNMRVAMKRYLDAGYGENFNQGNTSRTYRMTEASVNADFCYVNKRNMWRIPVGELRVDPLYGGRCNGITKTTDQKENAALLLQLIAEDEEFRKLLCFGREGSEYTVEDGVYIPNEEDSFYNMSFLSVMSHFSGIDTGTLIPKEEGKSRLQTHQDMIAKSNIWAPVTVGYGIDITGITAQIEAINKVVQENSNRVISMTEAEYDQFMADIQAAGGDKIQAELQRQLDEWLAANPDWQNP